MVLLEKLGVIGTKDEVIWNITSHPKSRIIASCGVSVAIWIDSSLRDHELYNEIGEGKLETNCGVRWVKAYDFGNFEHSKLIRKVSWSPCGNMLICASFDSTISIWEFVSKDIGWACICKILGPESEVKCVDWNCYDNLVAACCRDRAIWIFYLIIDHKRIKGTPIEYDCVGVLTAHTNDIKKVKWHPVIPTVLFSCSYDDTIIIWAPSSLTTDENEKHSFDWIKYYTLSGHNSTVWDFTLCPNGEYLLSCSDDSSIILWHSSREDVDISKFTWEIGSALNNTFKLILRNSLNVRNLSKYVQIGRLSEFTENCDKELYSYPIYSVEWCKYLNCIISASADNSLNLFSINDSRELKHIHREANAHDGEINTISWLNDNQKGEFVSSGDDGRIILWKVTLND